MVHGRRLAVASVSGLVQVHRLDQGGSAMFKRILATTALLGVWALPLAAQGHAAKAGTEMTITGSVVDLNCNTTNGAAGTGHNAGAPARAKYPRPPGRL